jgi:hypothetical protein
MLLKGPRSHTSSITLFTGLQLVLLGVCCMGIAPKLPLLLCLLVHDWYYMEFAAWASLPNCQYYSIYGFTTSTTWSLLHGHHSQTVSTTPFTGSRLVLHGVCCMDFIPKLPVVLCLPVHDWCYMEFAAWALLPN